MLLFDTGKKLEKAFTKEQFDALVEVLEKRDGSLATSQEVSDVKTNLKGDITSVKTELRETELRLQKEIEVVRGEIKNTEMRLLKEIKVVRGEIKGTEIRLLKWQIGGWGALAAIMAKGFGWLGF